jgi:hypothetical protein
MQRQVGEDKGQRKKLDFCLVYFERLIDGSISEYGGKIEMDRAE